MSAAAITLLRHGDTGRHGFRGQLDDPLTDAGWTQLRAAVAGGECDAIVSSPLQRCAAFARELAGVRGVPLQLDRRLAEYHFGDWQGVPLDALAAAQGDALAAFWRDPDANVPPGAESFVAFRARVVAALDDIATHARTSRMLVVTHGGVIRLLRCIAENRPCSAMAGLDVPHASLHRFDWPVHARLACGVAT